jgi:hypothetical protein
MLHTRGRPEWLAPRQVARLARAPTSCRRTGRRGSRPAPSSAAWGTAGSWRSRWFAAACWSSRRPGWRFPRRSARQGTGGWPGRLWRCRCCGKGACRGSAAWAAAPAAAVARRLGLPSGWRSRLAAGGRQHSLQHSLQQGRAGQGRAGQGRAGQGKVPLPPPLRARPTEAERRQAGHRGRAKQRRRATHQRQPVYEHVGQQAGVLLPPAAQPRVPADEALEVVLALAVPRQPDLARLRLGHACLADLHEEEDDLARDVAGDAVHVHVAAPRHLRATSRQPRAHAAQEPQSRGLPPRARAQAPAGPPRGWLMSGRQARPCVQHHRAADQLGASWCRQVQGAGGRGQGAGCLAAQGGAAPHHVDQLDVVVVAVAKRLVYLLVLLDTRLEVAQRLQGRVGGWVGWVGLGGSLGGSVRQWGRQVFCWGGGWGGGGVGGWGVVSAACAPHSNACQCAKALPGAPAMLLSAAGVRRPQPSTPTPTPHPSPASQHTCSVSTPL